MSVEKRCYRHFVCLESVVARDCRCQSQSFESIDPVVRTAKVVGKVREKD